MTRYLKISFLWRGDLQVLLPKNTVTMRSTIPATETTATHQGGCVSTLLTPGVFLLVSGAEEFRRGEELRLELFRLIKRNKYMFKIVLVNYSTKIKLTICSFLSELFIYTDLNTNAVNKRHTGNG